MMLHKWKHVLLNSKSKEAHISRLSQQVSEEIGPQCKESYIAEGTSLLTNGNVHPMNDCTQKEPDTRIVVHQLHALKTGRRKVVVNTVDADIVEKLIHQFFKLI